MNPSLPERVVDEAMERDPEAARAEYMAEFRSDLETFLLREVVDAAMREALSNIQNGAYAKKFLKEGASGYPLMTEARAANAAHGIEQVGEKLRAMMPWIAANKIVDQAKN
jgi:ketol-acid reductoisomerase